MKVPKSRVLNIGVAALFASALFMTANAPISARHAQAKALKTLRLNYNVGVDWNATLDPANTAFVNDADTEYLMNAGLVKINTHSQVYLDGASKVSISKNKKVFTFTIRKNLRFANGRRATASDFLYSLTRAAKSTVDPQEATTYDDLIKGLDAYNAGKAKKVSGLKVLKGNKLQITIRTPAVYFLSALAYPTDFVLDKHVVGGLKIGPGMTTKCTANKGAGPFVPICRNSGTSLSSFYPSGSSPIMHLKPNKYYYGRKPHIKIDLPVIASNDTAYAKYKAGEMDTSGIPVSFISQWRGKKDFREWGTTLVIYINTDTTSAPFNNVHCRLAVAHSIDRLTIANKILKGADKPLYTVLPPGFLGYFNGKKTTPYYSPKKARAELAKCPGKLNGLTWPYRVTTADARNVRNATESMMKAVGINVKMQDITRAENTRYQTTPMKTTGAHILRSGWQQDYPDPQDYCFLLLRTGQTYAISGWKNKKYNSLVDRGNLETNVKKRAALYVAAQKIALSQAVWIPEFLGVNFALVKPKVHGLVTTAAFDDLMPKNQDWANVSIK